MSFVEDIKHDFLIRKEAARDKALSWPQFFLTGILDYIWIIAIQSPVIRELHAHFKLFSTLWILIAVGAIYYANKVIRIYVLTWNLDIQPGVSGSVPTTPQLQQAPNPPSMAAHSPVDTSVPSTPIELR